jgi:two-component system NtrC family response regulator
MDIKGFSPEFIEVMNRHDWPGNVRELVHTMESILAVAAADPILYPKHLPVEIRVKLLQESLVPPKSAEAPAGAPAEASPLADILSSRQASDRRYLSSLIAQTGGKVQEMIRVSGLSRAQLYNLMKAHGLNRQSSSSS